MARALYTVVNNWGTGLVGNVAVEAGALPLNGWELSFTAAFNITDIWGAEIVSYVGGVYTVRSVAWNGSVAAGASASFGFVGVGSGPATGFTLAGPPAAVTPPALSLANAQQAEGQAGMMNFALTLSAASATPVTVAWATQDGTALAGQDYDAASGTVTFAPGETTRTISVALRQDALFENDEGFNIQLSAPSGATLARATATGTILNDDAAPGLSIGGASQAEGSAGTAAMNFTVSLSTASGLPVTVAWATQNGTALAGQDYVAAAGTLTFAPGETSKVVSVAIRGDTVIEADEDFSVVLSNAGGAGIVLGNGVGTIRNDDVPASAVLPALSVADVSVVEGNMMSGGAAPGWLSTRGNQIVDAAGTPIKIAGVNWFGMESDLYVPHGLWARGYKEMMGQMADLGFNAIRLPFSSDSLRATQISGIDYDKNADLRGLTSIEVMDKMVEEAGRLGMRVVLDHHVVNSGKMVGENGYWFSASVSEDQWVADWQMLAARYATNPVVIGGDLHNEPWLGTWGGGGATDWDRAAERAGNAIQAVNPNWLIFVEGVSVANNDSYWWGGNLQGVRDNPVTLTIPGKVVYSPHDYPNSIFPQSWFQAPDFADRLTQKFDQNWGYIFRENLAPVMLGEFGTRLEDPKDQVWLQKITAYLDGDFNADGVRDLPAVQLGMSWMWWSWNPNSSDTGGILKDDWRGVNQAKVDAVQPLMFDLAGAPGQSNVAGFVVSLTAPTAQAVSVDWRTVPGTANAADFVAASGTLTFAPGERTKVVPVTILGDRATEADETFTLLLDNPRGATIADGIGLGTILNDDAVVVAPPPPASLLTGRVTMTQNWGNGFTADITVRNTGTTTVTGWGVEVESDYALLNLWNGTIGANTGDGFMVGGVWWNSTLAPGAEATFGVSMQGVFQPGALDLVFG